MQVTIISDLPVLFLVVLVAGIIVSVLSMLSKRRKKNRGPYFLEDDYVGGDEG